MPICCALSSVKSGIANLYNSITMDPKQTIYQRFEVFKTQNPENKHFDVVFDIHGQKLYANKYTLCSVSTTFKSMLSDQWTKSDEPIKLEEYSFKAFKELITFIYSGECQFCEANVFTIVDIAEFYAVKSLKMFCGKYLIRMLNLENVYQFIQLAEKYSMRELKGAAIDFASKDISSFVQSEKFCNLPKSFVSDLLESNHKAPKQEELFEAIFQWAVTRAMESQTSDNNWEEAIKNELSEFLPFVNFKLMTHSFLIKNVVRKQFLFSDDELKSIIFRAQNEVYVNVVDQNGRIMRGCLHCPDLQKVVAVINSQKNVCCYANEGVSFCWNTLTTKPKTPNKLAKNDDVEWYLLFASKANVGDLAIKHRMQLIKGNYLLAEMFAERFFILDEKCKIEIV